MLSYEINWFMQFLLTVYFALAFLCSFSLQRNNFIVLLCKQHTLIMREHEIVQQNKLGKKEYQGLKIVH